MNPLIKRPHGVVEVCATFGYIDDFKDKLPKWEAQMDLTPFPFPVVADWNRNLHIANARLHHLVIPFFKLAIDRIFEEGLHPLITTFGGGYTYRKITGGNGYSMHSWGIAFDINCFENARGTAGNMSVDIINIFEEYGFYWGGKFKPTPDPMHFQFCTGC